MLTASDLKKPVAVLTEVAIVSVAINIGLVAYLIFAPKPVQTNCFENEVSQQLTEEQISEQMKAGETGQLETKEGQTPEQALAEVNPGAISNPVIPPNTSMPATIFNTQGTVVTVEKDGITITGNGSNFEDQKERQIVIKFSDTTVTFEKNNKVRYTGMDGLKHIVAGDKILVESDQNIRGKTEFAANYINKI
ncbi:MAG: hypothetical protein WC949_00770 [Candidatus Paceibacterota bacterium]|jgi:hypothetical protein